MKPQCHIISVGIHSCLGNSKNAVGCALFDGRSGIVSDDYRALMHYHSSLTGNVRDVERPRGISTRVWQRFSQPARYAYDAVRQAIENASSQLPDRVGLIVSCDSQALSGYDTYVQWRNLASQGKPTTAIGASKVFQDLNSSVSMNLAQHFRFTGPTMTLSAACAGGLHAIGIAKMWIETGFCDTVMVVGAQEVNPYSIVSFDATTMFSQKASMPMCAERDGLVPSGGAAAVLLSSSVPGSVRCGSAASFPGGISKGIIERYAANTSPDGLVTPSHQSEVDCMNAALGDNHSPDIVIAHATGTVIGDNTEAQAIIDTCGEGQLVQTYKALTGHEMWMAGVSSLVYALIDHQQGSISPTLTGTPLTDRLQFCRVRQNDNHIRTLLINAFGFGGTNASIFVRWNR